MRKLDLSKCLEDVSADLISIPSESGQEKEIVDSIEDVLIRQCRNNNIQVNRYDNNVVVRYHNGRPAKNKTIGLVGHVDTVPASRENHTHPKFSDGKLYGLGSVDMKSSDAMMLKLCYELSQETFVPDHNVSLIFYDGEEAPLPNGITRLLQGDLRSVIKNIDFAYVLEPTQGRYEIGCLGSLTAEVTIKGKSAHSASPWLGDNAIYNSADVINRVKNFENKCLMIDGHDITETMNITTIQTANSHNMIPGNVLLRINYRFSPEQSIKTAREIVESVCDDNHIFFVDESPSAYAPVNGCHTMKDGIPKGIIRGWTDIAQLINSGIPAVNFGPGNITVAHKPEEYIDVAELNDFYQNLKGHL